LSNIFTILENTPIVKPLIKWSKLTAIPGFQGVPIYYIIRFIIEELKKDSITTRADAVAFNFFLSIFPFTIFILPLLINTPFGINYLELFRNSIKGVLPNSAQEYIFSIITGIENTGSFGLLTAGFFFAIYFSSNGMSKLMQGFDKSHPNIFKSRNFINHKLVAIALTVLLVMLGLFSLTLIVLFGQFVQYLAANVEIGSFSLVLVNILRWLVILLLFYSIITSIYRYGPSMYQRIKLFNPGATLATLLSILSSVLFSWFVNQFDRYNEIYGSISALIVMLIWIQINSFILLIGFELNTSIAVNKELGRFRKEGVQNVEESHEEVVRK